jgi:hypothetical protein
MGPSEKLFMPEEPEKNCLGIAIDQIRDFLNAFDCRMAEASALEGIIRGIAKARGEAWPWVDQWFREEAHRWVNDMETVFFEISLEKLTGSHSLSFTQHVWMLQPSVFEYQVWSGRAFVRMWWNRKRSAFPEQAQS